MISTSTIQIFKVFVLLLLTFVPVTDARLYNKQTESNSISSSNNNNTPSSGRASPRLLFDLGNNNNDGDDNDELHILIGYKRNATIGSNSFRLNRLEGIGERLFADSDDRSFQIRKRFTSLRVVSTSVKRYQLDQLLQNDDIDYIEEDVMVYPNSETNLYGLDMVQLVPPTGYPTATIPPYNATTIGGSSCSNPLSMKIGIIDGGISTNHPDLGCTDITSRTTNCIGKEFDIGVGDQWYNPILKDHGTHVAGTIGATILNNDGISGIINDNQFCYIIGRVFGETVEGTRMSTILESIEWVASKGAKVINMSLGTSTPSRTARNVVDTLYKRGIILVAAAGNEGNTEKHFPASFASVLSVAAVDEQQKHATFSQYNNAVDIAAPGVNIVSTSPLTSGGVVFIKSTNSISVVANHLLFANTSNVAGILVACPNLGQSTCPGPGNHICLIERGVNTFEEKVLNCQASGGIGAIIYNNEIGYQINGGVNEQTKTSIPAYEVTLADGQRLLNGALQTYVTISKRKGYTWLSGTSMACPHVTGIAALLWRQCSDCTNVQIMDCLKQSATDLGTPGKDQYYGHGLVQAQDAYTCLQTIQLCC